MTGYDEAAALRDAVSRVVELFPNIIREMPINRAPGATGEPRPRHVHGFYEPASERNEELLVISEFQFRRKLTGTLTPLEQKALDLGSDRGEGTVHPGFAHVAEALLAEGLIPGTVRGVPVQEQTGLMTVKSGSKFYRGMFPVSLEMLRRSLGDELDDLIRFWVKGDRFGLTFLATGWDYTDDDLKALSGEKEAADRSAESTDRCPACGKALKEDRSGKYVQCSDYTAPAARRCGVRYALSGGQRVTTCQRCGKELVVVEKARPRHMACPQRCGKEQKDAA